VIGGGKTIDFGISNSAEFFDILSRTLYTDQILAVVREVLCNAWDAHIAAGRTNTPIQITLDSDSFVVRDFGFGIPHDDIGPIYGVYGNSTKKNDGLQTGGFGLGCKAPFAYTDHFEVISHHLGKKTIYNMSKSNAVAKGKPGIITIASMATDETGLRVKMPIQNKDRMRFHELIRRIISNGEMRAELNGQLQPTIAFSQARNGYLLTHQDVMGSRSQDYILLRYGNVIYPIENNDEIGDLYAKVSAMLKNFPHYKLILQAPPDSISVTPSRESLSMQEHTINTVKRLFKDFLAQTKTLDAETLNQGKQLVDASIAKKSYDALFSSGWGFERGMVRDADITHITDLRGMASFQLTRDYPVRNIQFRLQDLNYRVRKAADTKMVDARLADTFLEELPVVKEVPSDYTYRERHSSSDWLSRRVLGKAVSKLIAKGLDPKSLYIFDSKQPGRSYNDSKLTRATEATLRNHLLNLRFLRKVVVVTTAMTRLEERLRYYACHHEGLPTDGMLCYYVGSRKAGSADTALELFAKLGYEVIDLTKRHSWEQVDRPPPGPPKKREPYPGLPALSNILRIDNSIKTQAFRTDEALKLPNPTLVMVIGARNSENAIDGFSTAATKALVQLYGSRVGIAKDLTEVKRAVKHGAVDFYPVLEAELIAALTQSPTVDEYFAYEYKRVRDTLNWRVASDALSLIYTDDDLRNEFGIKNNLTDSEKAMVKIFRQATCLTGPCSEAIIKHIESITLAPENQKAIDAITNNELLDMLDIPVIKSGLRGPKRQVYLDVFTKILKG
jgi:hypothetical protein